MSEAQTRTPESESDLDYADDLVAQLSDGWPANRKMIAMQPGTEQPGTDLTIPAQIAASIRASIMDGTLRPGDSLPPVHQIAGDWETSTGSARAAIGMLRQQGLITTGRGRAPIVRLPRRQVVRDSARHQTEKDWALEPEVIRRQHGEAEDDLGLPLDQTDFRADYQVIKASPELAELFSIAPGTELLRKIYETRDKSGWTRYAYSVSYVPLALIESNPKLLDGDEEPWPGGAMHQFRTVGIEIADVIDEVTGVAPSPVDAQRWGLEDGVPMLWVRRISVDTTGRVVEVSDACYPADRTKLRFRTPLRPWER